MKRPAIRQPYEPDQRTVQKFSNALCGESVCETTPGIVNALLDGGEYVVLKKNELLVQFGSVNRDIYFVVDGCIRGSYIDDSGVERTQAFGLCGSLVYSPSSHTMGQPSLFQYSATCPTVVLRIPKDRYDTLIDRNTEFCKWMMGAFELRIYSWENRNERMRMDASTRYRYVLQRRPALTAYVTDKLMASYLGISEVHLSRIKKNVLKSI